jgi:hypothetical protein
MSLPVRCICLDTHTVCVNKYCAQEL